MTSNAIVSTKRAYKIKKNEVDRHIYEKVAEQLSQNICDVWPVIYVNQYIRHRCNDYMQHLFREAVYNCAHYKNKR
jgi:maltooligosyltrehalose synthase